MCKSLSISQGVSAVMILQLQGNQTIPLNSFISKVESNPNPGSHSSKCDHLRYIYMYNIRVCLCMCMQLNSYVTKLSSHVFFIENKVYSLINQQKPLKFLDNGSYYSGYLD